MVGATRGTPEGFRPDQASGSQQPPPPPPNLAEVMARLTDRTPEHVSAGPATSVPFSSTWT
jgi:hypothetical protein